MTAAINAQAKKSLNDTAKKNGIATEQVAQINALNKEKGKKIKAVKALNLSKEETKVKIKAINKANYPKVTKIIGKEKMKAISAYWRKSKKALIYND